MTNYDFEEDDDEDFVPEEMDIPISNSDCCNEPTATVEGYLTCTKCGEICNPKQ
jgi:hypothetical protein